MNTWRRCLWLALTLLVAPWVQAAQEPQLINAINGYRGEVQRCAGQAFEPLPPLAADRRLELPVAASGDLQQELTRVGYPMVTVQAIILSGPRDAASALQALSESFCQILLDPQFVDIGISREDRDWRIVLARPLLSAKLGDVKTEGQKLLEHINRARAQSRQCGKQSFSATAALTWNDSLGAAAQDHSRAMANGNFFSHLDRDGRTPGDRAELAGYEGTHVGENIAAAQDSSERVVEAWLASPDHCANLMNPQFSELGAAYGSDPKSDAGIYWTALFGGR
nr:CAP domain-containing protein [Pseudomonas sp. 8Z]